MEIKMEKNAQIKRLILNLEIDEMLGFRQASTDEYKQKSNRDGVRIHGKTCGCGSNRPWTHCCGSKNYMTVKFK